MDVVLRSRRGPMALGGWTSVHGVTATGIRYVRYQIVTYLLWDTRTAA